MLVFCQECGERYIFEQDELENGPTQFECRVCGEIVVVSLDDIKGSPPAPSD